MAEQKARESTVREEKGIVMTIKLSITTAKLGRHS